MSYESAQPTREEVDSWPGPVVLEFGTNWCPICQAAQPEIQQQLGAFPEIRHVKVEDGKGRPLGRSFRVKLWPNLVFLRDGEVIAQLARPEGSEIRAALQRLVS